MFFGICEQGAIGSFMGKLSDERAMDMQNVGVVGIGFHEAVKLAASNEAELISALANARAMHWGTVCRLVIEPSPKWGRTDRHVTADEAVTLLGNCLRLASR